MGKKVEKEKEKCRERELIKEPNRGVSPVKRESESNGNPSQTHAQEGGRGGGRGHGEDSIARIAHMQDVCEMGEQSGGSWRRGC